MKRHLLVGHDDDVARFVTERAPIERPLFKPPFWGFGMLNDKGTLVAGCVVHDWQPDFLRCEVSGVAISYYAVSSEIVETIYGGFIFGQLAANRVHARTSVNNERACRLLEHIGFIREAVSADYYGVGHHSVTYRLLKREWDARNVLAKAA